MVDRWAGGLSIRHPSHFLERPCVCVYMHLYTCLIRWLDVIWFLMHILHLVQAGSKKGKCPNQFSPLVTITAECIIPGALTELFQLDHWHYFSIWLHTTSIFSTAVGVYCLLSPGAVSSISVWPAIQEWVYSHTNANSTWAAPLQLQLNSFPAGEHYISFVMDCNMLEKNCCMQRESNGVGQKQLCPQIKWCVFSQESKVQLWKLQQKLAGLSFPKGPFVRKKKINDKRPQK